MKTTLDLPEDLMRRAKAVAALRGTTLTKVVTEALEKAVLIQPKEETGGKPAWWSGFGALKDLKEENARIAQLIEDEFGVVDEEDAK